MPCVLLKLHSKWKICGFHLLESFIDRNWESSTWFKTKSRYSAVIIISFNSKCSQVSLLMSDETLLWITPILTLYGRPAILSICKWIDFNFGCIRVNVEIANLARLQFKYIYMVFLFLCWPWTSHCLSLTGYPHPLTLKRGT